MIKIINFTLSNFSIKTFALIILLAIIVTLSACGAKNEDSIQENRNVDTHNLEAIGNVDLTDPALDKVKDEISKFDSLNFFSFKMLDINTGKGISYNADEKTTSQSTIKGPFCASVIENNPSAFVQDKELFKQTITVSNGEAYEALRDKYGTTNFKNWCEELDIDISIATTLYPRNMTANIMTKIWQKMYKVLNDEKMPKEFVDYFTGTKFSAIYKELGSKYKTQSKPGWENGTTDDALSDDPDVPCDAKHTDGDPTNDEIATNDAGIIYANGKPYIFVIFTSVSSNPERLQPLISAIDEYHSFVF